MPEANAQDSVPAEELTAQLTRTVGLLTENLTKLSERPATPAEKPAPEAAQRVYTRAELKQAKDAGQISWTDDQIDQYLDGARESQIEKRVSENLERKFKGQSRNDRVQGKISEYTAAKPELLKAGSPEREAVTKRFDQLVSELEYDPKDPRTELLALQREFGDAESLQPAVETTGERTTRTTAGRSAQTSKASSAGPLDKLSPNHRTHFENQIAQGAFKGLDDPKLVKQVDTILARQKARAGR